MRHSFVRTFTLLALFLWVGHGARAEETNAPPFNLWFHVGEETVYEIHWGVVPVGTTRVTTKWILFNDKPALQIRMITKTKSLMDKVYPVDDFIESVIDPESFLPIRFIKRLKEGRYRADETTLFDFKSLTASWSSKTNGRKKEFAIDPDTRDIVSFMYYVRQFPFEPGQTNNYRVMADEKLYDLTVDVHGVDVLKLPKYGPVPSSKLHPTAAFQGIFVRSGEITIWVSRDPRRVCTRIMAQVPVANVRLNIVDVLGPGDDFWVQPKKD